MTFRKVVIGLTLIAPLFALGGVRGATAQEMPSSDVKCRQVLALGVRRLGATVLAKCRSVLRCQGTVGAALQTYMSTRAKEQQRCQVQKDLGMIPSTDCMTADLNGRIAGKLAKMQEVIEQCVKACGDELSDSMFVDVYEPR